MEKPCISVQNLLYSFVKDVRRFDPELGQSLAGLPARVSRLVSSRGLRVVMIDFPEAGSLFDKALSGKVDCSSLPPSLGSWKKGTFIGYPLLKRIFTKRGNHSACDPNYIFFMRTLFFMFKKVKMDCSQSAVNTTIDSFVSLQSKLRSPSGNWNYGREFSLPPVSFRDVLRYDLPLFGAPFPSRGMGLLQEVCDVLTSRLPELDPYSLIPRHGPGAVADMNRNGDKYLFPSWSEKLEVVFPHRYHTRYHGDLDPSDRSVFIQSDREISARLLAVPKTLKKPRLITCEPTANQYIQQGILKWFRKHLPGPLRQCIDFRSQEPSRDLALRASRDGSYATIDLSSASDRLTCWTVERAFRCNTGLLSALHSSRSRMVTIDSFEGREPETILLRMFSGQGSAVTFPVQSIIYSYICIAAVLYDMGWSATYRNICRAARRVRVFGDDLIIRTEHVPSLVHLLESLELKVNETKSHWSGPFRESCGMDSYRGYDVTPFYLSDLELRNNNLSLISWIEVSNNAYRKGLWETSDYMWSSIPEKIRYLVPVSNHSLSCLGAFSYSTNFHSDAKPTWSRRFQRWEVPSLMVQVRDTRRSRGSNQDLLQYFIEGTTNGDFYVLNVDRPFTVGVLRRSVFRLRKTRVPMS